MVDLSHWRPNASQQMLRARARLYRQVREFFYQRGVLEVDTPALSRFANPDPNIHSLEVENPLLGLAAEPWYLHTSPEFFMKRLLADGCGASYQICKVFRGQEHGRHHCHEFAMLEWYRPGVSLDELMDEVDALLRCLLPQLNSPEKLSYFDLMQSALGVDAHHASVEQLQQVARQQGLTVEGLQHEPRSAWLDVLFSHCVQPALGQQRVSFVVDFPLDQCALARINPAPKLGAARFEAIVAGLELANGYDELIDSDANRQRFADDLQRRRQRGQVVAPYDDWLLAALAAGMPDSCGVAMGLDRVLMLQQNAPRIDDVLSFSAERS